MRTKEQQEISELVRDWLQATAPSVTRAQVKSLLRTIRHQGLKNLSHSGPWPIADQSEYIGVYFKHITIGIEPDGYAHS